VLRVRPKRALIETQQIIARRTDWPGFKILDAIPHSDEYGNVISPDLHVEGPLAAFDPSNRGFSGYVEVLSPGFRPPMWVICSSGLWGCGFVIQITWLVISSLACICESQC
jgi:hypothetical protein